MAFLVSYGWLVLPVLSYSVFRLFFGISEKEKKIDENNKRYKKLADDITTNAVQASLIEDSIRDKRVTGSQISVGIGFIIWLVICIF